MHGCSESRFVIVSCEVMKKQAVHDKLVAIYKYAINRKVSFCALHDQ